jgi:hypothetical protein
MIRVEGKEVAVARLKQVDVAVQSQVMSVVLDSAAETTREIAADNAPQRSGRLKASMAVYGEGPRARDVGPGVFYGLFLERGTGQRYQKRSGRHTGSVSSRPFLRPALDDPRVQESARKSFMDEMRKLGAV